MNLPIRNPQVAKELRPLFWPWVGTILAGSLLVLRPAVGEGVGLEGLLMGVVIYGFFGGMAFLAAVSFGEEFQERTLSLLLSQPVSRQQLWNKKMALLAGAVLAALAFEAVLIGVLSRSPIAGPVMDSLKQTFDQEELLVAGAFILATVCTAGFWTLVAGSTVGGLVFTVTCEFACGVTAALIYSGFSRYSDPPRNLMLLTAAVATTVYSIVLLWLGRRMFLTLEVKPARSAAAGPSRGRVWERVPALQILVCRPAARLPNFVRKEIRLLKPITQLAFVFLLCWIGVALVQWLWPKQRITYVFDLLTFIYAPITCLLAGALSLGEEKTLGLAETQLTLPFSIAWQWVLKLLTCGLVAALLGLGLPLALVLVTGDWLHLDESSLVQEKDNTLSALACLSGVGFLLAFWASAHVESAVRAAIVTIIGTIVGGFSMALGIMWGSHGNELLSPVLVTVMQRLRLSPNQMLLTGSAAERYLWVPLAMVVLLGLYQGYRQFRRARPALSKLLWDSLVLALAILLVSLLCSDFVRSLEHLGDSAPFEELRTALNAIARIDVDQAGSHHQTVPHEALRGRVSAETESWLRDATVSYEVQKDSRFLDQRFSAFSRRYGLSPYSYNARIQFKDGTSFDFPGGPLPWPRKR
jgi:ABC-2 family transporter